MSHEERLSHIISTIEPIDPACSDRAWERLDQLTKPPRSLGRLELLAAQVSSIQDDVRPAVAERAIVLAAADHGVVAEGVSPYPQEVTWQMVANFVAGGAAINQLAAAAGARLLLVDVGVRDDTSCLEGVRQEKIRPGTANMAVGPAMTRGQAAQAVMVGVDIAAELADQGIKLLGTGEMGIGNTTASSALTAAFCGRAPVDVVGRGTGLDDEGVTLKAQVIERAMKVNDIDADDPLGVLASVGGLEIGVLAGVVLGAAARGIAVVVDGFISGAALLVAARMAPTVLEYAFASHRSVEPGHSVLLEELGLTPVLDLDMRLGEGTGGALAMGIIDSACRMLSGMATFAEAGVSEEEGS